MSAFDPKRTLMLVFYYLYYNNCMFRLILCIIFIALSIPLRADSIFDWTSTNIQS